MSASQRKPGAFGGNDLVFVACRRSTAPITKHVTPKASGSWWTKAEGGPEFSALAQAQVSRLTQVSSAPLPDLPTRRECRS